MFVVKEVCGWVTTIELQPEFIRQVRMDESGLRWRLAGCLFEMRSQRPRHPPFRQRLPLGGDNFHATRMVPRAHWAERECTAFCFPWFALWRLFSPR